MPETPWPPPPAAYREHEPPVGLGCPHCGVILDPPPTRPRKCPHCRGRVVPRTRRRDGAKFILTQIEAQQFDADRDAERARSTALRAAQGIGASEGQFARAASLLADEWNREPLSRDVFWRVANDAVTTAGRVKDWSRLAGIYWQMARWARGEGRDVRHLLRSSSEAKLRSMPYTRRVEIATCNDLDVCAACRSNAGRQMTRATALRRLPIPNDCEADFCRCSWAPVETG